VKIFVSTPPTSMSCELFSSRPLRLRHGDNGGRQGVRPKVQGKKHVSIFYSPLALRLCVRHCFWLLFVLLVFACAAPLREIHHSIGCLSLRLCAPARENGFAFYSVSRLCVRYVFLLLPLPLSTSLRPCARPCLFLESFPKKKPPLCSSPVIRGPLSARQAE
jgi:hypothetical protein